MLPERYPLTPRIPGENGSKIVFLRDFDSVDLQLFTIEPDASAPTSIYSPGGKSELVARRQADRPGLPEHQPPAVVRDLGDRPDASNAVQLTSNRFDDAEEPSWSPDGTKVGLRAGAPSPPAGPGIGGDIHVMNADGTGIVNITNDPAEDQEPAWSTES